MFAIIHLLATFIADLFKSRRRLEVENLFLRHQLNVVLRRAPQRVRIRAGDRALMVWMTRMWPSLLGLTRVVQPATILRWHRCGFRAYWRWKSRARPGRPRVERELRDLIRRMSEENPLWRLFAFVVLGHGRRQLLWFAVTRNPTAEWLAQQIVQAFPWNTAPTYLVRDNDGAYGQAFTRRLRTMGIRDRPTSPRSPWQNPYAERLIGTLRRECLDHVLIFGERHLRQILALYSSYYNQTRTHLALGKDAPLRRTVQGSGAIIATPILFGLHHRYARI
jgi:transposase InsO family protein